MNRAKSVITKFTKGCILPVVPESSSLVSERKGMGVTCSRANGTGGYEWRSFIEGVRRLEEDTVEVLAIISYINVREVRQSPTYQTSTATHSRVSLV